MAIRHLFGTRISTLVCISTRRITSPQMPFKPRFISFDRYGTLNDFEMGPTAHRLFRDRVPSARMPAFLDSFPAYRLDEVLGEWNRGHGPASDSYGVSRLTDVRQLPGLLGL